jgi:hypothetical protein
LNIELVPCVKNAYRQNDLIISFVIYNSKVREIEVTGIAIPTVHKIISDLNFLKCLHTRFQKCSPRSTNVKEWLPHLKILATTKMEENCYGKHRYRR